MTVGINVAGLIQAQGFKLSITSMLFVHALHMSGQFLHCRNTGSQALVQLTGMRGADFVIQQGQTVCMQFSCCAADKMKVAVSYWVHFISGACACWKG